MGGSARPLRGDTSRADAGDERGAATDVDPYISVEDAARTAAKGTAGGRQRNRRADGREDLGGMAILADSSGAVSVLAAGGRSPVPAGPTARRAHLETSSAPP